MGTLMCGIVAARVDGGAAPFLLRALSLLEYRGYDSAGVAIVTEDASTAVIRSVGRVGGLTTDVAAWSGAPLTGLGIGHTRWATHGAVTTRNAHPHRDCTGRISVAHNGIIENHRALRQELEADGHVFASDVDSEVVCHLIEDHLESSGDLLRSVHAATRRLEGSWALVVTDAETGRLVAAAHHSPLIVASSAIGDFVTSDIGAIADWVDEYRTLVDGDIVELADELVWTRDGQRAATPQAALCPFTSAALERGSHADYMAKEIDEQPAIAARILDDLVPHIADGSLWRSLEAPAFERIAVLGCGTSLNAGRVIARAFGALGGIPTVSVVASEASETILDPGTLILALSQSGETADILRALDQLEPVSAGLVAVTNNPASSVARRAASVVDCNAGPEIGVAATKTFVAQVITGVAVAVSALVATGRIDRSRAADLTDDLRRLPDLLAQALEVSKGVVPGIVDEVLDRSGFIFLGRGAGVVFAEEGALKLKEISYRWAEHYPAGELKHGPLALVDQGTPVIVVDNGDPRLASNLSEVAARGGRVITIGGAGSTIPAVGMSMSRPLVGGMDRWGPLEAVVPLQLFARELALRLGLDVDKPRNLAKSVTVE